MAAKRIKLFVDAHSFDTEFQGAQTFIRELYTQLMADHPELDIYFGAYDVENIQSIFPDLPAANILAYKKRKFGLLRFVLDIPALLKKHRFDFAHFQYIIPKKTAGCKYIVTLHDVLFNDYPQDFSFIYRVSRNLLFGRSIKKAHIKTTVSAYSKQRICSYYNIPDNEIHIIQNGVSNALMQFQNNKQEAEELIKDKFGVENFILYTSRIEPRKNHLLLLRHYLRLKLYEQGIGLVFIGRESVNVPELTKLVIRLTAEQKPFFHWFQQVSQADLAAFYRACRVFVYPTKAEGFGIPPLEAAICEVPVLCSSAPAMSDFDFFDPYIVDPANDQELGEKLSAMLSKPPSDAFISDVAKQVAKQYNWQNSSNTFYNLLQANTI